jgi:hypothetical protein
VIEDDVEDGSAEGGSSIAEAPVEDLALVGDAS